MRRTSGWMIGGVVLLMVASSGCSSNESAAPPGTAPQTLTQVISATKAAGGMRLKGTRSGQNSNDVGQIDGVAADGRGKVTISASPSGNPPAHDVRWVSGKTVVGRPVGTNANAGGVLARRPGEPEFVDVSVPYNRNLALLQTGLIDPFAALQQASQSTVVGTESVGGDQWTHYTTSAPGQSTGSTVFSATGTLDVWADSQHRLRRVRQTRGTQTISYDVTDFGVAVDVSIPNELSTPGTGPKSTTTTQPPGPFAEAVAGASNGVMWSLKRADRPQGGTCWRLDLGPAAGGTASNEGRPFCYDDVEPNAEPEDQLQPVINTPADGPNGVAVVVPAGVSGTNVGFADRHREPAVVNGNAAVWVGPGSPQPVLVELNGPKGRLTCGPGITDYSDLDKVQPAELPALRANPWLCQAPIE